MDAQEKTLPELHTEAQIRLGELITAEKAAHAATLAQGRLVRNLKEIAKNAGISLEDVVLKTDAGDET